MNTITKRFLSLLLTLVMLGTVTACGTAAGTDDPTPSETKSAQDGSDLSEAVEGEKIINIGVTDSLGGINPFAIDQTEINKYAMDLTFLPLMELDKDLNFQGMLVRRYAGHCGGCGIFGAALRQPCGGQYHSPVVRIRRDRRRDRFCGGRGHIDRGRYLAG